MQELFAVTDQTNEKTNAGANITKCKEEFKKSEILATMALWCGVVWCGVVWCGVVWCGVVWAINLSKNSLYKYTDFI